jgi:hypothetical protein
MLVMEMLGFNALFNIYEEEDEALQFLGASGAVAEAPEAAPVAPVTPTVAPRTVPPRVPSGVQPRVAVTAGGQISFPMEAECSRCHQKLEIPGAGTFRCPRCAQMCTVDGSGKAAFPATRLPAPVEVSIPATSSFAGVVAALAEGIAVTMGINSNKAQNIRDNVGGLIMKMVDVSYKADATNAINVLLVPTDAGLRSEIVDNGTGLDASAISSAADDVKVTPHPVKGNVYTLLYRR